MTSNTDVPHILIHRMISIFFWSKISYHCTCTVCVRHCMSTHACMCLGVSELGREGQGGGGGEGGSERWQSLTADALRKSNWRLSLAYPATQYQRTQ